MGVTRAGDRRPFKPPAKPLVTTHKNSMSHQLASSFASFMGWTLCPRKSHAPDTSSSSPSLPVICMHLANRVTGTAFINASRASFHSGRARTTYLVNSNNTISCVWIPFRYRIHLQERLPGNNEIIFTTSSTNNELDIGRRAKQTTSWT